MANRPEPVNHLAMSDPTEAATSFEDAVSLWRITPQSMSQEVIDAATECLVAGMDSPSLRELAGASARESQFVLEPLITSTVGELGMSRLFTTDAQAAALRVILRKLEAGELTAREIASWSHTHIGHDSSLKFQPFVSLDDLYDEADYLGYDKHEIDEWMRQEAVAFLAGTPSPGWAVKSPGRTMDRKPQSLLDRIRARLRRR
jgi:hypothetical protein